MDDLTRELIGALDQVYPPNLDTVNGKGRDDAAPWSMMAQGLTFGGADEAEAWVRSQMGEEYETALQDVRQRLSAYRDSFPVEAFTFEAGGAALPAVVGSMFTGGGAGVAASARMFPQLAKIAALSAGEGGLYAFNTGEGGFGNRAERVPGGLAAGTFGGAVGYAAGKTVVGGAAKAMDYARRKLGDRASRTVEAELRRAMKASGIDSMDDAWDLVASGQLLAENKTMRGIARGLRSTSSEADGVFRKVYDPIDGSVPRQENLRRETMGYLQDKLTDGVDGNILKNYKLTEDALEAGASADFQRAFQGVDDVGDELTAELVESLRRVPSASKPLNELHRAQTGKTPFFNMADDGVSFTRNPNLEEAEIVHRALKTATNKQYVKGAGDVGTAFKGVARGVQDSIDNVSPDLKAVRAKWAEIRSAREAFEEGRKAIARKADQVALDFDAATQKGEGILKAYRAGVADAFRSRASTGTRKSMPRNLADPGANEGQVMRQVFPGDDLPRMETLANRAAGAQDAASEILGGSQTAPTMGRVAEQGGPGLLDVAVDTAFTGPSALIQYARGAIKNLKPKLTAKEAAQIARLMVEENPDELIRAMTDSGGAGRIGGMITNYMQRLSGKASISAGAGVGGAANEAMRGLFGPQ